MKNDREQPKKTAVPPSAEALEALFARCADLNRRELGAGADGAPALTLLWLDGLVDARALAEELLRPLSDPRLFSPLPPEALRERLLAGGLNAASVKDCADLDEAADALTHGCALLFYAPRGALTAELRASGRSVSEPTLEKSLKGAQDAFTETLRVNTALLRRRLASPALKLVESTLGRRSRTKAALLYLDGAADPALVRAAAAKLDSLEADALLTLGQAEAALSEAPRSPFPQLLHTERPDRLALHLSEGRVGLLIDGLPIALVLPATLAEFLEASGDRSRPLPVRAALKALRWAALAIGLLLPALYVAMAGFHQEMIPTRLLLSLIEAKQQVPFSTALEVMGMLASFILLQEAGLRLPGPMSDTVSVIGALLVGQAAVEARVVSPIAIIVVAASGIACYTLPSQDLASAVRLCSFGLLFAGALAGLYGVALGCCLLLWHLCGLESFGLSYTARRKRGKGS